LQLAPLPLHDALPISILTGVCCAAGHVRVEFFVRPTRDLHTNDMIGSQNDKLFLAIYAAWPLSLCELSNDLTPKARRTCNYFSTCHANSVDRTSLSRDSTVMRTISKSLK